MPDGTFIETNATTQEELSLAGPDSCFFVRPVARPRPGPIILDLKPVMVDGRTQYLSLHELKKMI